MFHKDETFPDKKIIPVLAELYADIFLLSNISSPKFNLPANAWGFLYEENDVGYIGERLIQFGDITIPYIEKYLTDTNFVLYEGSEDALIGNAYQYRIKDIAAFYIAKIRNIPISFYHDFEARDKEIEHLKAMMIRE